MSTAATPEVKVEEGRLKEIEQEALAVVAQTKAIVVTDQATYDRACAVLTHKLKPAIEKGNEFFDPNIALAHTLHKNLIAQKKTVMEPLCAEETRFKKGILDFELDQRRIEEQRQREAAAEQERQHQEQVLSTAVEAEQAGASEEEVGAILEQPSFAPPPVAAPAFNRAKGVSLKETWKAEVTDLKALCAAIGRGEVPTTYVVANDSALNAIARAQREQTKIPGVRAYSTANLAARSR